MAILDSIRGRFDESLKADKVNTLQALIFACKDVDNYNLKLKDGHEVNRMEKIYIRTIQSFDLYKEKGRNTYGGPTLEDSIKFINGSYSDEEMRLLKIKFNKNYQDGGAMGIWTNSNLELSPLATRVAEHEITISRYLSIVFLNLFSFATKTEGDDPKYFHLLQTLLDYIEEKNLEDEQITVSNIKEAYFGFVDETTEEHRKAQMRAMFQYLAGTEYFDDIGDYKMVVNRKWKNKLNLLKSFCNNEYENITFAESQKQFNNTTSRSDYTKVISNTQYEKEIVSIIEDRPIVSLSNESKVIDMPHQLIVTGAPGTGKSKYLKDKAEKYFVNTHEKNYERVTFHSSLSYGQFVGVFKPFPSNDKDILIEYRYIPGPLLRILESAYINPTKNYLLIIEEINRANVSAVFGDIFQLLDRKDGQSEFPITLSEDIKYRFFNKKNGVLNNNNNEDNIDVINLVRNEGLVLPKNLYLWATMNAADQNVLPLDTAFKRRWRYKKFDVNTVSPDVQDYFSDKYILSKGNKIKWNDVRIAINNKLTSLNISEDKLLGAFFISKEDMKDDQKLTESFKDKVLLYLFEDVVRTRPRQLFDLKEGLYSYSYLIKEFEENGLKIFHELDFGNDSED